MMTAWILRLGTYDERLLHLVVRRRRPLLDRFMCTVTRLADWPVALAITLRCCSGPCRGWSGRVERPRGRSRSRTWESKS
jgi:hypothetical protein